MLGGVGVQMLGFLGRLLLHHVVSNHKDGCAFGIDRTEHVQDDYLHTPPWHTQRQTIRSLKLPVVAGQPVFESSSLICFLVLVTNLQDGRTVKANKK